jgi:hypothetical protein
VALGLIRANDIPKMEFFSAKGERKPVVTFQVEHIKELYEWLEGALKWKK